MADETSKAAPAPGKRTLTLNVTVPQNVDVVLKTERVGTTLNIDAAPNAQLEHVLASVDLPSNKTKSWLESVSEVVNDPSCCCVRG